MIKEIVKDVIFLGRRARPASPEDVSIGDDLIDTLAHHKGTCVGMAANMIGQSVSIIAFDNDGEYMVMYNPEIVRKSEPYNSEEGCLSLTGVRPVRRYKHIKVKYQNRDFAERYKTFSGWTAQIIQHEIDHCMGIII